MSKSVRCQRLFVALLIVILASSQKTVSLRRIEKLAALALIANAGAFGGGQKFIPVPVYVNGGGGHKAKESHPQPKVLQPIIVTGCGAGHGGGYPALGLGGGAIGGAHGVW